jgi:hypothetical protein
MIVKYPLWLRFCHTAALCVLIYAFAAAYATRDLIYAVLFMTANAEFLICNLARFRFRTAVLSSMRESDADKVRFV